MFFHTMKYTLLNLLRDKGQVFWCVAFPLLLGTMFHFAFGGLGSGESFSAIPVAVVMQEESSELRSMFDSLSKPGEDQFLEVTYASAADAKELLKAKEVYGIITADLPTVSDYRNAASAKDVSTYPLSLTLSAEMTSDPLYQSILSVLVDRFNIEYSAIAQAAMKDPTKLPALLDAVSTEVSYIRHESLGAGSVDESLTYFFNLIAMTCLYAAMIGNTLAISNQANLSDLGARRNVSPVPRLLAALGDLTGALIFEFSSLLITIAYLTLVLKVDFGNHLGGVALTCLCGCLAGLSLGFLVGCIGQFSKETKFGFLMAAIMMLLFKRSDDRKHACTCGRFLPAAQPHQSCSSHLRCAVFTRRVPVLHTVFYKYRRTPVTLGTFLSRRSCTGKEEKICQSLKHFSQSQKNGEMPH